MKNANVDYCGMLNLLRYLLKTGDYQEKELRKVAARLRIECGAELPVSL